jgi:hypothetical protein
MSAAALTGGCHCGAIRFTAVIDLDAPTISCNCSILTKSRARLAPIPKTDFLLESGDDFITEYRFGARGITHCFCRQCGVKRHGRVMGESGEDELIAVSVQCLDLAPGALEAVPRSYHDGRADRPDRQPEITGYL